ncbi:MAG: hypothetical protein V8R95_00955 [Faecalibacterium sp.]
MENILKVFLMAFPEWLACIFMVVGLVVTALAAVRLGYGLVVAKTVYKWIVNAEEKFGAGAGAEKKAHVIAVLRGYTPDWRQALGGILLFALVPSLAIASCLAKYLYKKTGSVYVAAFLNTILMTMMTVANTAIYFQA